MIKPRIILIAGPTGVGKTAASVFLAKKIDTDIISCDSMQIYKGMDIGTAKVTPEEAMGVRHYMTDIINPDQSFSVADYVKTATPIVYDIASRGKPALLVGGTGLYADSLIKGTDFQEEAAADPDYRTEMFDIAEEKGAEYVHSMLMDVDPESARNIHPNNIKRVIRALEYYHATGEKISEHNEQTKAIESPFESLRLYFTRDREALYYRIDKRVDMMVEKGLLNEVEKLLSLGVPRESTAMQALGYKEMADAIEGLITFDEAIDIIKRDSRRYAKRQLTWFRRDKEGIWLNLDDIPTPEDVAEKCMKIIKERNML